MKRKIKELRVNIRSFLKNVSKEIDETKEAGAIIKKYAAGHKLSSEEKSIVKTQAADLLKSAGIGVPFLLVPGASIILPILILTAKKNKINLLPTSFSPKDKPGK